MVKKNGGGGWWMALAAPLVLALLAGCRKAPSEHVVLYVSADDHVAREVARAFEAETGIRIDLVGDTELKKTTGLVERLRSESDHPQADVFWSSEQSLTIALADEGVLAAYDVPALEAWPKAYRDEQHRWYAFAARARVIVYHRERVLAVPENWTDLAQNTAYRDRIVMADPRFGTTGSHLAAMKVFWDRHAMRGFYEVFLDKLAENNVRLLPGGNAAVVQSIIDGAADLGMTDTDDVWAARARGFDLGMVYAGHLRALPRGRGTFLIPNTVALVRGGPNPENAGRLLEFLLSERVERLLAESDSHNIPLNPALKDAYPELAIDAALAVDPGRIAANRAKAIATAMKRLADAG